MDIRVLGPVEASVAERPVVLRAAKQRAVLAMLALEANHTVSMDRLIALLLPRGSERLNEAVDDARLGRATGVSSGATSRSLRLGAAI